MSQNPFATPAVDDSFDPGTESDDTRIRNEHLKHEANIQAIGSLWILGGGMGVLIGGLGIVGSLTGSVGAGEATFLGVYFAFGAFVLWTGIQTRKLLPSVRIPATILASIGLIGVPIGTMINGYMLYLIHSAKGKMVLSERYQGIRARTPHIKYRTSIVVIVFALLLLAMVIFVAVASITR